MKLRHLLLFVSFLFYLLPASVHASLITNGDFETFTNGLPDGWTYTQEPYGPSTIESAFTSPFGEGGSSVRLEDGLSHNSNPTLYQSFSTVSKGFNVSFDFYLDDNDLSDSDGWRIALRSGGAYKTLAQINVNSDLRIPDGPHISLNDNQWYRYEAEISSDPFDRFLLEGTLTRFGGSSVEFSTSTGTHCAFYDSLMFFDDTDTVSTSSPIYLDNVSFSTSSVPIPGAIWMIGPGLIGLVGFRKKKLINSN